MKRKAEKELEPNRKRKKRKRGNGLIITLRSMNKPQPPIPYPDKHLDHTPSPLAKPNLAVPTPKTTYLDNFPGVFPSPDIQANPSPSTKKRRGRGEEEDFDYIPEGPPDYEEYETIFVSGIQHRRKKKRSKRKRKSSSTGKRKKKKPVTTNMSTNMRKCFAILKKLKEHGDSIMFREPVDVVKYGCPQYHEIIKEPMDLLTIEKKMISCKYSTIMEWVDDVRQIFRNCFIFNNPNDHVYKSGKKLKDYFDQLYRGVLTNTFLNSAPYLTEEEKEERRKKRERMRKRQKEKEEEKKRKKKSTKKKRFTMKERRDVAKRVSQLTERQVGIVIELYKIYDKTGVGRVRGKEKFDINFQSVSADAINVILLYLNKEVKRKRKR